MNNSNHTNVQAHLLPPSGLECGLQFCTYHQIRQNFIHLKIVLLTCARHNFYFDVDFVQAAVMTVFPLRN